MPLDAADKISFELIKGLSSKSMTVSELANSTAINFQVISDVVGGSYYAALSPHQYVMIATILELDSDKLIELGQVLENTITENPF